MFLRYSLLLSFFLSAPSVYSQSEIRGLVLDTKGKPIPGASVYLHETYQGSISDSAGNFVIHRVRKGSYHLHASMIGYSSYAMDIEAGDSILFMRIVLEESALELNEFVIESNMLKVSSRQSSVPILSVNEDFLRKNQGNTLMQALERLPGIQAVNTGIGISKPAIRGLSGNRVLVAEYGIRQEGQQWGGDHGLEIDQFNVERIEVLKGPASLLFGSEALGGVIHIRQPEFPAEGEHKGEAGMVYRSVNQTYGVTALAKGNHKGFTYRLRLTGMDYGDYQVPATNFTYNNYLLPIYDHHLKNTAGKEGHISLGLGVSRKWGYSRITLSNFHQEIGIFSGAVGVPRAYQLERDGNSRDFGLPYQGVNHFKVVSNSNINFGKSWLETDIGYQLNSREEHSAPHAHGRPAGISDLAHGLFLQTLSANSRYHKKTFGHLDGIYGASLQYQQHRFTGFEFLLPRFKTLSGALYLVETWKANARTTLNGGLRADLAKINISRHLQETYKNGVFSGLAERSPEINRTFVNWSGSLGVSYDLRKEINLKLNLGKSFRVPVPQELSANGVHHGSFRHEQGSSDLLSEQGYQLDVSLNYEVNKFRFSLTPFLNYFDHFIYLRPTGLFSSLPEGGQIYRYTQSEALHTGFEVQAEYHPLKQLHLEMNLSYVAAQNLETALPLPFMPPLNGMLEAEYTVSEAGRHFSEIYVKLGYRYSAAQERIDRNEFATPAYHLVNSGLGGKLLVKGKERVDLSVSISNLSDQYYLNHLSRWRVLNLAEPGRNLNLILRFPVG